MIGSSNLHGYLIRNKFESCDNYYEASDNEGKLYVIKHHSFVDLSPEEIKVILGISSCHLVKCADVFSEKDDNSTFFVMEHCENCITSGKFASLSKTVIFSELVVSIFVLHSENIIHGDIRPETVFVDEKGICKICCFGTSGLVRKSIEKIISSEIQPCMAPEMVLTGSVSQACDLFALGATMYAFYEGSDLPREKSSPFGACFPLQFKNEKIPLDVKDIITGLVSTSPAERPTIGSVALLPSIRTQIENFRWEPLSPALRGMYDANPPTNPANPNPHPNPRPNPYPNPIASHHFDGASSTDSLHGADSRSQERSVNPVSPNSIDVITETSFSSPNNAGGSSTGGCANITSSSSGSDRSGETSSGSETGGQSSGSKTGEKGSSTRAAKNPGSSPPSDEYAHVLLPSSLNFYMQNSLVSNDGCEITSSCWGKLCKFDVTKGFKTAFVRTPMQEGVYCWSMHVKCDGIGWTLDIGTVDADCFTNFSQRTFSENGEGCFRLEMKEKGKLHVSLEGVYDDVPPKWNCEVELICGSPLVAVEAEVDTKTHQLLLTVRGTKMEAIILGVNAPCYVGAAGSGGAAFHSVDVVDVGVGTVITKPHLFLWK